MKKTYEKPTATVISFQLNEDLTINGETGVSEAPPGLIEFSLEPGKNDYQLH